MNEINRIKWSLKKLDGSEKRGLVQPKGIWVFQNEGKVEFINVINVIKRP